MEKQYYNKLLNFIKNNPNDWKELLGKEPCFITIKKGIDSLYMFSYDQRKSDFSNDIVKACRGCIVDIEDVSNPEMVCTPFYKFMNYSESSCDEIDWSTAVTTEKIDGELVKLFYYKKEDNWFWVTNNDFDIKHRFSFTLPSKYVEKESENAKTIEDLIKIALLNNNLPSNFYYSLDKDYTYMFELISPKRRIIVDYPITKMYYLGRRNVKTYKEELPNDMFNWFDIPSTYNCRCLEDALIKCKDYIGTENEGLVVCDANFNRIKIKAEDYLNFKYSIKNKSFSKQSLLESIRNNTIDDLIGNFPETKNDFETVKETIIQYNNFCDKLRLFGHQVFEKIKLIEPDANKWRSEYSKFASSYSKEIANILFSIFNEPTIEQMENLLSKAENFDYNFEFYDINKKDK